MPTINSITEKTREVHIENRRIEEIEDVYKKISSIRLFHCRRAGELFFDIKKTFKENNITKTNPLMTEDATYISWSNYLEKNNFHRSSVNRYLKVYEKWDVIKKLGLLDKDAGYHLLQTLRIVEWSKKKVKENPSWLETQEYVLEGEQEVLVTGKVLKGELDPNQANVKLIPKYRVYYLEQNAQKQETKRTYQEILKENEELKVQLIEQKESLRRKNLNLELLKAELNYHKKRAASLEESVQYLEDN